MKIFVVKNIIFLVILSGSNNDVNEGDAVKLGCVLVVGPSGNIFTWSDIVRPTLKTCVRNSYTS